MQLPRDNFRCATKMVGMIKTALETAGDFSQAASIPKNPTKQVRQFITSNQSRSNLIKPASREIQSEEANQD